MDMLTVLMAGLFWIATLIAWFGVSLVLAVLVGKMIAKRDAGYPQPPSSQQGMVR